MGGKHSAPRTDPNLQALNYFGYSKDDIDGVISQLNKAEHWRDNCCGWSKEDIRKAREFIEMVKTILRKDRYRLMELMTSNASFASVVLQMKQLTTKDIFV